jgi:hypothetical protein
MLYRLAQVHFPASRIKIEGVKSTKGFVANHTSPLEASAQAQNTFGATADRLIGSVR